MSIVSKRSSQHFNRFEREDEKPFEAVAEVSDFNQRAYELFVQPFVQAMSNETTARLLRAFHPLRLQRWAFSDHESVARVARARRPTRSRRTAQARRRTSSRGAMPRHGGSEIVSASLDYYRAMRDAATEAAVLLRLRQHVLRRIAQTRHAAPAAAARRPTRASCRSCRKRSHRSRQGGYAEAVARAAFLLRRTASRCRSRASCCSRNWRRLRGVSAELAARSVAAHSRRAGNHRALRAGAGDRRRLPTLLARPTIERKRILTLLDKLLADERVQARPADRRAARDARTHSRGAARQGRTRAARGDARALNAVVISVISPLPGSRRGT